MDTLNTLLLGWLVFGVFMVVLAKFLYDKFLSGDQADEDEGDPSYQEVGNAEGCKGPPPPPPVERKKATIVPDELPKHLPAPIATGGDPDAVRWINNLLVWFFEGSEGGPIVREAWNDNLNEYTVGTALETGVLIEILEFLPQSTAPTLSNIIVDCSPADDITVTCDMSVTLYMRVQTTRTQRDVTTESEYACAVRPLRGRLNIGVKTHQCVGIIKFDGWPEVNMELEGVRNNTEGLDEFQLQEVVKEELTSALRKVTLELDFLSRKTFPRFSRGRSLPDNVIPVGYDALVRERQTHPPSFEPKIPASRTPVPVRSKNKQSPKPATVSNPPLPSAVPPREGVSVMSQSQSEDMTLPKGDFFPTPDEGAAKLLTLSEESLVRRNLERYVEQLPKDTKSKEAKGVGASHPKENHTPNQPPLHAPLCRASMVFSSREKPIDEPNGTLAPDRLEDEEAEEEEELGHFSDLKNVEKISPSLTGPPPPPRGPAVSPTKSPALSSARSPTRSPPRSPARSPARSPTKDFESLKESFKESLKNNPFSKHLPSVGGGSISTSPPPPSSPPVGIVGLNGKRLLVKVVKATGVGGDAGVSACYVVSEMDDPPQKFSTSVVSDTSSPFWDEQFLFDLSDNTLELLFELYDKVDGRFVGLGIVGIEELVATPSQRQIIPLQGRPYEKDEVSGSLTCEFLFLDRADLPDLTLRKTVGGQLAGGKAKTTTTTYVKPPEETQPEEVVGASAGGVAEAALKDLQEGKHSSAPDVPSTRSTLIIHSSRKPVEEQSSEEEDDENFKPGVSVKYGTGMSSGGGSYAQGSASQRSSVPPTGAPAPSTSVSTTNSRPPAEITESQAPNLPSPDSNGLGVDDRGRSRNRRKRDFFGSLRRRFSRSKIRSKSVDPTGVGVDAGGVDESLDRNPVGARSISMERSTSILRSRGKSTVSSPTSQGSQTQRLLTVPIGKGRSTPSGGIGSGDSGSTRSSLSGTSGLSSASTKTYINEASLLVVETLENGIIKHYLVPLSLQRKNKWRKKGTKLHIYNEHTFVAKHLSSSVSCQVCQKGLGRRLGKQGYECRDCSFKCHKPCHVKADIICPNSTVNSMDLVYVKDENAERRKRLQTS